MRRAILPGVIIVAALLLLAARQRGPTFGRYQLTVVDATRVPVMLGPEDLTEDDALEWQLDAQEQNWNAEVTLYRWDDASESWALA